MDGGRGGQLFYLRRKKRKGLGAERTQLHQVYLISRPSHQSQTSKSMQPLKQQGSSNLKDQGLIPETSMS